MGAVTLTERVPGAPQNSAVAEVDGPARPRPHTRGYFVKKTAVDHDYFRALDARIVAGRVALGADRVRIVQAMLHRTLKQIGLGCLLGGVLIALLTLDPELGYRPKWWHLGVLLGSLALMATVCAAACIVPTARARRRADGGVGRRGLTVLSYTSSSPLRAPSDPRRSPEHEHQSQHALPVRQRQEVQALPRKEVR